MIVRRRISRERRWEQREILKSWEKDLRYEGDFEDALLKSATVDTDRHMKGKVNHAEKRAMEHLMLAPVYRGEAQSEWRELFIICLDS